MSMTLADRIIALGAVRDGTLRDALATALGDPTLSFVDPGGVPPRPDREHTVVADAAGVHAAVLDHRAGLLREEGLRRDVAQAVLLALGHERLTRELGAQIDELASSSRRLLAVSDTERRALGQRVETRAGVHLESVATALAQARGLGFETAALDDKLIRCRGELVELADGLFPLALRLGSLADAIAGLATASSLPVTTTVTVGDLAPELAATAYFVCSEGLANVAKYAHAERAWIVIAPTAASIAIEVGDDGTGGASLEAGSGLPGLVERVAAVGGTLRLESPPGVGTRLLAELPAQ